MTRALAASCVMAAAVALSGCSGGHGSTSSASGAPGALHRKDHAAGRNRPVQRSKPQPVPSRIVESFNARLVSIQVVHVHWRLAHPAVLRLNVASAHADGSTRGGAAGWLPLPPSDFAHSRTASAGSGHAHLNFEFGDYDFNDSPKVQFRLVAISGRRRDRSQPITLSRTRSG
jgi:hypothetical protein